MVYSKLLYMQYLPQKAFWGPLLYTCTCHDIVKSVRRMCLRVLKRSQSEDSLIFAEITQNDKINVIWGNILRTRMQVLTRSVGPHSVGVQSRLSPRKACNTNAYARTDARTDGPTFG